ncbi:putative C2H2 finger domain protein [Aspergillus sclerotioniger CBS 115572]|uniref:Putative C2H2 finger domain protein n=1 Tax=Aspergillus sclerotioniger CBS 115572 TaxID=1450535 RepID=A0A317XDT3_9EURO|nr:putative C2H2 finger domain protein [Aspergillus sclerotioniger CBS 115572]PWY96689.1 putative C2H2 finger domain protein [Aspergillus sclerotioniger CBS 115572]
MPRAEAGSTKAIGNKIKAKGLGRLRWYCQACSRQMRDENGYKCHVQSESHVRQVLLIGEDPKRYIEDFSKEFLSNFLNLLRTGHGEKKVHINQFYQQVIADKEHIHMNATKWKSLTQFAAYLGREGLCRVEETEKGLFVSYIDRSPEAMRRQEALLKKERQDRGDEELEQRQLQEQIKRAQENAKEEEVDPEARILQRKEGEKVKLNIGFGSKTGDSKSESPKPASSDEKDSGASTTPETASASSAPAPASASAPAQPQAAPKVSLSFGGGSNKPKNVFAAAAKKNPLAGKKGSVLEQPKKMTEQERIMKQEMEAMERKRMRGPSGFPDAKRPRVS